MTTTEKKNMMMQVISELILVPVALYFITQWLGLCIYIYEIYIIIVGFQLLSAIFNVITQRFVKKEEE